MLVRDLVSPVVPPDAIRARCGGVKHSSRKRGLGGCKPPPTKSAADPEPDGAVVKVAMVTPI